MNSIESTRPGFSQTKKISETTSQNALENRINKIAKKLMADNGITEPSGTYYSRTYLLYKNNIEKCARFLAENGLYWIVFLLI